MYYISSLILISIYYFLPSTFHSKLTYTDSFIKSKFFDFGTTHINSFSFPFNNRMCWSIPCSSRLEFLLTFVPELSSTRSWDKDRCTVEVIDYSGRDITPSSCTMTHRIPSVGIMKWFSWRQLFLWHWPVWAQYKLRREGPTPNCTNREGRQFIFNKTANDFTIPSKIRYTDYSQYW